MGPRERAGHGCLLCSTCGADHVFAIDEPRGCLWRCTRDQLAKYARRQVNLNLVAAANPAHVEIIEDYQ